MTTLLLLHLLLKRYLGKLGSWFKRYWIDALWLIGWFFAWYSFYLVWGKLTWDWDTAIFKPGWYFAELGHLIFGCLWGLNYIYLVKRFSLIPLISGLKLQRIFIWSSFTCILAGIGWEYGEIVGWDNFFQPNFYHLKALASKGDLDTLIDITLNPVGLIATFLFFCPVERFLYRRIYHMDPTDEEIKERFEEIMLLKRELRLKIKSLQSDKRKQLRAYLKEIRSRFRDHK